MHRLGQQRVHARCAETRFVFFGNVAGKSDDDLVARGSRFALANRLRGFEASHVGHFFVDQQHIEIMFLEFGDGGTAVGGTDGDVPTLFQQLDDEFAIDVGIVGDQDAQASCGFVFFRVRFDGGWFFGFGDGGGSCVGFFGARQPEPETRAAWRASFRADRAAPTFHRNFAEIKPKAGFAGVRFAFGEQRK